MAWDEIAKPAKRTLLCDSMNFKTQETATYEMKNDVMSAMKNYSFLLIIFLVFAVFIEKSARRVWTLSGIYYSLYSKFLSFIVLDMFWTADFKAAVISQDHKLICKFRILRFGSNILNLANSKTKNSDSDSVM